MPAYVLKNIFFVALSVLIIGCDKPEKPAKVNDVIVHTVEKQNVPIYGNYVARTQASLDVEVRSRITGYVEHVEFVEGSWVNEGDLLYQIDDKPYKTKVKRVEATLAKNRAALDKAKRDTARLEPLYQQGAASQLDLDNAISAQEQSKATVMATSAEYDEALLELSYTQVKAPISGMVGGSMADVGALVGNGGISLLTTIQRINPIYVTFNMSSLDYLNARRRMNSLLEQIEADKKGKSLAGFVRITLPDDSDYRYWGDVSFTDPKVNPKTGTFQVRAVLPNPDSELLPGQYTKAQIKLSEFANAVVVPEEATKVEQGGIYVMVVLDDNTVERRFIIVAHYGEAGLVVSSGLSAGEQIIVEGLHRARHGQKVNPITINKKGDV
ncbi:efflux RND transporter periplasmic adaptor subunit [Pseudoalteromonas sp. C2R02]|uniref:efflux RND transporter periplasmic adaptor subunit n=1 Tax=Pseudoalteromonas sp. C2R02 TaxID=2841565 RepID=UPI001C08A2D9|nr:efflux RND transporter periplasmic adaptor subunit [Pseudoalteromonas sp. C2R02]